ncbi:hypothetical protein [Faecalispora anaeroviscerum]|uniref:hypothetical protein n=1 Tax=Faecalispora anaeroviscerum TaxID=2991836 RepID=UPI0024BBE5C8|nr:hypothetical protein [Faecalispora anaeroviscerum]
MRIQSYHPYASGNISGTKSIGGISLPDFNDPLFPTKATASIDEDKIKEAVMKQAQEDQAAGTFQTSTGFKSLKTSYLSIVSPDRKGIITEGLKMITKKVPTVESLNLIDILFGKVSYKSESKSISYAEFYDSNGELVATYSNTGWNCYQTKAEAAQETEICMIYNEAWNNAAKANLNTGNTMQGNISNGSFNISV